ncbi:DegV family protein [Caproiciproducens sp.]|uniref:DegV family protein n=1 Tax=Caproiciproducens sp. TaxID=1954376 RepID=UPI00289D32DF|nr:DegV family protein [Caproiciproducens sp.]
MEKIALLTDSACDIDNETIRKYNINILPFKIIYKNREYTDKVDITPKEIYDNMKNEIPKSSQPAMEDIESVYRKLDLEHYTHVIAIVISSGLSGTYNAFKIISAKFLGIKTYIFDTKSTSVCEGIILKKCGALIKAGEKFDKIVHSIPEMKRKLHFFFVFGSLEYARKGGRIGKISGTIGELLDVKPIVSFDEEHGECFTYSKVRGRNRSLNKLVELGAEIIKGKKCDAYIVHGNVEEEAKKVNDMLLENANIENVHLIGQISAVVGVYSGPGTIGVCYSENE